VGRLLRILAGDVRTVKIRTGLVLDPTGGALGQYVAAFPIRPWRKIRKWKAVVVLDYFA
jgi:NAD dependent epimerase/dehydratase family enzyme